MTPSIAIDAGEISGTALADPRDRLLATARQLDATFLTADQLRLQYARDTRNLRAHDLTV